jgi:hypothetical protein
MNIRGIYSSVRHRADRYGHAYIRRLRRDLEMVQFLFCLRIWTPPLSIFEAATSPSSLSGCDVRALARSVVRSPTVVAARPRHPRLASPPRCRGAPATTLAASASTAATARALKPDATRPTKSQPGPLVPCGPLCRMLPGHRVGCCWSHWATESGSTGAADPVAWALESDITWTAESHPGPLSSPTGCPSQPQCSPAPSQLFATMDRLRVAYCPPEKVRDLKFG